MTILRPKYVEVNNITDLRTFNLEG